MAIYCVKSIGTEEQIVIAKKQQIRVCRLVCVVSIKCNFFCFPMCSIYQYEALAWSSDASRDSQGKMKRGTYTHFVAKAGYAPEKEVGYGQTFFNSP